MGKREPGLNGRVREQIELRRINERYRTARTGLRAAFGGLVAYFFYLAVDSVAGKTTVFSAVLSVIADFRLIAAFTLSGATAAWAIAERLVRQRKTAYMQGRIKELELKIDPARTTSGLTVKGKTHPMDKR